MRLQSFKSVAFLKCFLVFFLSYFGNTYAQSYYYFEISANSAVNTESNYIVFLNMGIDGNTNVRFKYKNPTTNEEHLVEQIYADSSLAKDNERLVFASSQPDFLIGNSDPNFLKFRINFKKKSDSLGIYYEPEGFDFQEVNNEWKAAVINKRLLKSDEDLRNDKDFLRIFFGESEDFFIYINQLNTRSLDKNELKSTFHLIVVANTTDAAIGTASQKDIEKITNTFSVLTSQLKINYVPKIIADSDFSINNVEKTIKTLKVNKQDIIVFYFSGHGFRFITDTSVFPRMSLRVNKLSILENNNLGVEHISEQLLKKNARVTIVLSDCCNESIDSRMPFGLSVLRPRATVNTLEKLNIDNCKKLFFPSNRISLVIGSAEKNQLSVCNPELGGFFTNFFQAELIKGLYSNQTSISWSQIVVAAKENTRRQALTALCGTNRCVQRAEIKFLTF